VKKLRLSARGGNPAIGLGDGQGFGRALYLS